MRSEWMKSAKILAPNLFSLIESNNTDSLIAYIRNQIISLETLSHLEPYFAYSPLTEFPNSQIDKRESKVELFKSSKMNVNKLTLLGTSTGKIWIGKNSSISNTLITCTSPTSSIVFGASSELSNCVIQLLGDNLSLIIAAGSTIPHGNFVLEEPGNYVLIGDDCMFSTGVFIRTSDSHSIFDRISGTRINYGRPVVINNHVWVGRQVLINKGTIIGSDAVIGQGAVTSGYLCGEAIHAGHPAKPIKEKIQWDRTQADTLEETLTIGNNRTRQLQFMQVCKDINELEKNVSIKSLPELQAVSAILASDFAFELIEELGSLCKEAFALRSNAKKIV